MLLDLVSKNILKSAKSVAIMSSWITKCKSLKKKSIPKHCFKIKPKVENKEMKMYVMFWHWQIPSPVAFSFGFEEYTNYVVWWSWHVVHKRIIKKIRLKSQEFRKSHTSFNIHYVCVLLRLYKKKKEGKVAFFTAFHDNISTLFYIIRIYDVYIRRYHGYHFIIV